MEHLTYFKVENFKRFESFEMDDIGQFNLILGDNNVGKTSVLEALLFDEDISKFIQNLGVVIYHVKNFKTFNGSYLDYFLNREGYQKHLTFYISESNFFTIQKEGDKWFYRNLPIVRRSVVTKLINAPARVLAEPEKIYLYRPNSEYKSISSLLSVSYISVFQSYDEDLISFYSSYIQTSKLQKRNLIESLRAIIPTVENIEVSTGEFLQPTLLIVRSDKDSVIPLAVFGEGSIKMFRILCEIVKNKGNRVMIDEIDAGIHFSRMKLFWKTILKAAKDNEVQLFITTHNEECLRYFKEALEEEDMVPLQKDARCFTLEEIKNGQVKAYKTGFEGFQHAIDMNINIRGGKVYG
ncbi:MAG: AAA family ATPase [Cytophagales bacterium]|nr:AAA family ATPase [Cytophagales bacterium]